MTLKLIPLQKREGKKSRCSGLRGGKSQQGLLRVPTRAFQVMEKASQGIKSLNQRGLGAEITFQEDRKAQRDQEQLRKAEIVHLEGLRECQVGGKGRLEKPRSKTRHSLGASRPSDLLPDFTLRKISVRGTVDKPRSQVKGLHPGKSDTWVH